MTNYEAHFITEDERYPFMVLRINGETVGGYYLNLNTLTFSNRKCVCFAHSSSECNCGVWDSYKE